MHGYHLHGYHVQLLEVFRRPPMALCRWSPLLRTSVPRSYVLSPVTEFLSALRPPSIAVWGRARAAKAFFLYFCPRGNVSGGNYFGSFVGQKVMFGPIALPPQYPNSLLGFRRLPRPGRIGDGEARDPLRAICNCLFEHHLTAHITQNVKLWLLRC